LFSLSQITHFGEFDCVEGRRRDMKEENEAVWKREKENGGS